MMYTTLARYMKCLSEGELRELGRAVPDPRAIFPLSHHAEMLQQGLSPYRCRQGEEAWFSWRPSRSAGSSQPRLASLEDTFTMRACWSRQPPVGERCERG